MNKEQLLKLTGELQQIGFEDIEGSLLQRICFLLPAFTLQRSVIHADDLFVFQLRFVRDDNQHYSFQYYDVQLQKIVHAETDVCSVDLRALHQQLLTVDWSTFKSADAVCSWEDAKLVEQICEQLEKLETTEEGKIIARQLKLQFWCGQVSEALYSTHSMGKQKNMISQRFYVNAEHPIKTDEACRFLQNKWIEQQMNFRKEKIATEESLKEETMKKVKKKANTSR